MYYYPVRNTRKQRAKPWLLESQPYLEIAKAIPIMLNFENRFCRWPSARGASDCPVAMMSDIVVVVAVVIVIVVKISMRQAGLVLCI